MDVGSNLVSGGNITVNAGSDIGMKASGLYAKGDVNLNAGGDVTIAAGEARHEEKARTSHAGYSDTTKATEETISTFAGVNYTYLKKDAVESAAIASNVAAGGNININARDGDVTVRGSNLDSYKDINVSAGQDIKFEVADQITKLDEHGVYAQVGALGEGKQTVTGTIRKVADLTTGAYKTIRDWNEEEEGESNGTIKQAKKAIELVQVVNKSQKAVEDVVALKEGFNATIKVGGKIGVTNVDKTKDNNVELASTAKAGGDVSLDAGRDVTMRGTQLSAENDVNIDAGRNLDIHASLDKTKEHERKTDGSLFGGVAGQVGDHGNALGFRVEVGAGYNATDTDNKIYNNAKVTAGQGLNVTTGGDAKIIGGNLKGDEVEMNIGGDLTLASLQNQKKTTTTKSGASMGFTFGFGAAGGEAGTTAKGDTADAASSNTVGTSGSGAESAASGMSSGATGAKATGESGKAADGKSGSDESLNVERDKSTVTASYSDEESNFVGAQASIEGKSKVNVYVEGNTNLKGSLINADNGNLKLDTGSLSYEDIKSTERNWKLGGGVEFASTDPKSKNLIFDNRKKVKEAREQAANEREANKKLAEAGGAGESSGSGSGKSSGDWWQPAADTGADIVEGAGKVGGTVAGWVLDNKVGSAAVGGIANGSAWAWDHLKPVDEYLDNLKTKPINIKVGYEENEQMARATIGLGEIVIRNNPEQDISGLNRDAEKSLTVEQKPIFYLNDTIKLDSVDIDIDDPAKTARKWMGYIKKTEEYSNKIQDSGGINNFIQAYTKGKAQSWRAKTSKE